MQNLGPAQVETLYKNTGKGDSLCDGMTAESLGVTPMVKGVSTREHSQNPRLTAGSLLYPECCGAARSLYGPESMTSEEHLHPPNPSGKSGIPGRAQPLLARMQVSL